MIFLNHLLIFSIIIIFLKFQCYYIDPYFITFNFIIFMINIYFCTISKKLDSIRFFQNSIFQHVVLFILIIILIKGFLHLFSFNLIYLYLYLFVLILFLINDIFIKQMDLYINNIFYLVDFYFHPLLNHIFIDPQTLNSFEA